MERKLVTPQQEGHGSLIDPPSNSFAPVLDQIQSRAFWADSAPFKGPRIASELLKYNDTVRCVNLGKGVSGLRQKQLTQILIVSS